MKNSLLCLLTLCAWSGWTHGQDVAPEQVAYDLRLYGLGEYENLGEIIYIGALYIPQRENVPRPGASARMDMAIVADSLSARRFTQLWTDAITLSSSREERVALTSQIQAFGGMFEDRIMRGDRISFLYLESAGQTVVIIDEVRIGEIPGTGFFNILLNAWVGETPLSGRLKSGIVGHSGAGEQTRIKRQFANTGYADERHRQIADIYAAGPESSIAPDAAAMAENAAAIEARLAAESAAQREEEARLAAERAQAERLKQAILAAEREEKAKAAAELARIELEQAQLAAEYRSELIKWLSNYADYPRRALERGQEGRVDLAVSSNRHGEILSKEIVTSSGDSSLDHAAMQMLERGSPLPPMPEKLYGDTFALNMPVNFSF